MRLQCDWEYVADIVMGGRSSGGLAIETVQGRPTARLTGDVSLENNGGFIQMAFDLRQDGCGREVSGWRGIALDVSGNDQEYELRVRTTDLSRPWESFRAAFQAQPEWKTSNFRFADLKPHRTDATFDPGRLRRIGIVAVGREFQVDIAVSAVRMIRQA